MSLLQMMETRIYVLVLACVLVFMQLCFPLGPGGSTVGTLPAPLTTTTTTTTTQTKMIPSRKIHRKSHQHGGIVLFWHIPKTAGSSIGHNMRSYPWIDYVFGKGPKKCRHFHAKMNEATTRNITDRLPLDTKKVMWGEVHTGCDSILEIRESLASWRAAAEQRGIPFFAFTMLRDPVSWAISAFEYFCVDPTYQRCKKVYQADTEENLLETALPNPQLNFLSHSWLHGGGMTPRRVDPTLQDEEEIIDLILDQFDWVGRVEEFNETVYVLEQILDEKLMDAFALNVYNTNAKGALHKDTLTHEGLAHIQGISEIDQELYDKLSQAYTLKDRFAD